MAKTLKTFKGSATANKKDPIVFNIGDTKIEALPQVDGWTTIKFVEGFASDDTGETMKAVRLYIEKSFDATNKKLFEREIENPENGFKIEDIVEILSYLMEERGGGKDLAESSE